MKKSPLSNIWFLNTGVLCIALFLIAQLGYIQIAQGEMYRSRAENTLSGNVGGSLNRGTIFFEEKTGRKISAATIAPDYTLALDPSQIENPEKIATDLAAILSIDRATILPKAERKNDRYEVVLEHVSESTVERIRALKTRGVIVQNEKKRFYPGGTLAAHVLGFVGSNGNTVSGRYGLERYYEETLARKDDSSSPSFFAELFLKQGKSLLLDRERAGDLVTTIEPSVQGFFERTLTDDIYKYYHAAGAWGIIMNPKTGEIYAMGSTPSFDPNYFSKEKDQSVFVNPLVEGTYEMGSVIKALTVAAGIDSGVITAKTTYDDTGSRVINTKKIANFDGKARGVVSMQEVLNQSLNLGSAFIAERLGHDRFRDYFKSFGLGQETGIDLPNESAGNLNNLTSPRDLEYATASFGQGISATPIASIRAFAALANGGVLVTPHVVKKTEYSFGVSREFVPQNEKRVIKKETAAEVTRMLTEAVDTALLEGTLKMERYSIAAKTGTAQQVGSGGAYSDSDFLHTFFGYFPAKDPQFIIFLSVKNPRGQQYASHTLSKPFMQIAKFLINYYHIPPDR